MQTTNSPGAVFTDAQRRAVVDRCRSGRLPQWVIAAQAGVSLSCLRSWLRRFPPAPPPSGPSWIELPADVRSPAPAAAPYKVSLLNGAVVELPPGFQADEAARLLRLLQSL